MASRKVYWEEVNASLRHVSLSCRWQKSRIERIKTINSGTALFFASTFIKYAPSIICSKHKLLLAHIIYLPTACQENSSKIFFRFWSKAHNSKSRVVVQGISNKQVKIGLFGGVL